MEIVFYLRLSPCTSDICTFQLRPDFYIIHLVAVAKIASMIVVLSSPMFLQNFSRGLVDWLETALPVLDALHRYRTLGLERKRPQPN